MVNPTLRTQAITPPGGEALGTRLEFAASTVGGKTATTALDPAQLSAAYSQTIALNLALSGATRNVEKPADPVYTKAAESFGVLRHIEPADHLYRVARQGIEDLREDFASHPPGGTQTLLGRIAAYIDALYAQAGDDARARAELDRFFGPFRTPDGFRFRSRSVDFVEPGKDIAVPGTEIRHNAYTALFHNGRVIQTDIRDMERLRTALARFRRFRQRRLAAAQARLVQVDEQIPVAREALDNLDRQRLEALADYHVAQRLGGEDWAAVERRYTERRTALEEHEGLYYVRVRESALGQELPDPLALRTRAAGDLVPGCPAPDGELPPALEPFMETVLDIPIGDWAELRERYTLLPPRHRLEALVRQRMARLEYKASAPVPAVPLGTGRRLNVLQRQNQGLLQQLLRVEVAPTASLRDYQRSARGALSVDDLLTGPPHRLQQAAQALRNRLDQATHCLLDGLRRIGPALRLSWARAAEQDRLPVQHPERWPGLEQAEAGDFNALRSLVELVAWWSRQLHESAGGTSHSALRNLIRACLILAADDDPQQILHGRLQSTPGRLRPGEALRVQLNREAAPGTRLQLLDTHSRVVGTLRVDDFDAQGALATVTAVLDPTVEPSTRFTVTALLTPLPGG